MDKLPKSYLPEEEKQGLSRNALYACESMAADEAGDTEAAWAWLALAEIPAYAMKALRRIAGEDLLREKGFRLEGPGGNGSRLVLP